MKNDRRIIKTKKAIINALAELIEEKGFSSITIKDLTERANINRGTFYLHYVDKYDMLKSIEEDIFEDFASIYKAHYGNGKMDWTFTNSPNPIVLEVLQYVEESHRLFKAILGPKGDSNFSNNLRLYIGNLVAHEEILKSVAEKSDIPIEYTVAYFASADLGVLQFWLESDMDIPVEKVAILLTKMLAFGFITFGEMTK